MKHHDEGGGAKRSLTKRIALGVGGAALGTVTFAVAAVAGVFLHSGMPAARRAMVHEINAALSGQFRGRIDVEQIKRLGFGRIEGVRASLYDGTGRKVVFVDGVRAKIGLPALAWAMIGGKNDIPITIFDARIDELDVDLEKNAEGDLSLLDALKPAHPSTSPPSSKHTVISVDGLVLGHAHVHGGYVASPHVDAELREAHVDVYSSPDKTSIGVAPFDLVAHELLNGPADLHARLEARFATPARSGHGVDARFVFDGRLGEARATVNATMAGDAVDAVVDVPQTPPEALVQLVPSLPVDRPVAVHVEAHGTLPELRPMATIDVGDGVVSLDGKIRVSDEPRADVHVAVVGLEPRAFQKTAPAGKLSAALHAIAVLKKGGGVEGTYALRTLPAVVNDQEIPETRSAGRFTANSVSGTLAVDEAGLPTDVDFDVQTGGAAGTVVAFDARARADDLAKVPRIKRVALRGKASMRVHGRVALADETVDADVDVGASAVGRGDMRADLAKVKGRVHGPLAEPDVDVVVIGEGVQLGGGRALRRIAVTTQGPVKRPLVTASLDADGLPHLDLLAGLDLSHGVDVRGAEMKLAREDVTMHVRAREVRDEGGVLTIDGAVIDGLGKPIEGSARIAPGRLEVRAKGDDVDLGRVAKLAGKSSQLHEGHAALDVDMKVHDEAADGRVRLDVRQAAFGAVKRADAHVALDFAGRSVTGKVNAEVKDAGRLALVADKVELAGSPLTPAAWEHAKGGLDVRSEVDLDRLAALAPNPDALPLAKMAGVVTLVAKIVRPDPEKAPDVALDVTTRGLDLAGKRPYPPEDQAHPHRQEAVGPPKYPWELVGLDFQVGARIDGASGHTTLDTKVVDPHGELAALAAKSDLPIEEILRDPSRARGLLEPLPFAIHVDAPERALESLPPILRPAAWRGFFGFTLDVTGDSRAPHVKLAARGHDVRSTQPHAATPLDVAVDASYDAKVGDVHVAVARPRQGTVIDAHAKVNAALDELRSARGGELPWTAEGDVRFLGFPLQAVPMLSDRMIEGNVRGDVKLTGLHQNGKVDAHLDLAGLKLDEVACERGTVDVTLGDGAAKASVDLQSKDGRVHTDVNAGLLWGGAVAPAPDKGRPIEVALQAKNFRARALMPFLEDAVNELDGRIDADAKVHIDPGFTNGRMDGKVDLSKGSFELPSIGEEFQNVHASVDIKPWGTVNVRNVGADGMTGHLDAWAKAKLDGLQFVSAEGHVNIAQGQAMPITLQGVPMGQAYGKIDVTAQRSKDGKAIDVVANVPTLNAELPQATGHSVQDLGDAPDIEVGTYNARHQFVLLPLHAPEEPRSPSASHLHVVANLGDIQVRRDTDLRIYLTGRPVVDVTDKTHMSGQIELRRGRVELYGKRFQVQPGGTVTFTGGEPSDPQLKVTALYDAPDGTKVYADVTGPVKEMKVTLRSEPTHTQNEILSLILFGSIQGETGTPPPDRQPNAESEAAGVAGGVVTQGLNRMLEGVSQFQIQTRLDTSDAQDPRPEVEVQVSERVMLDVTYNLGLPPPGENPDRTLVTVDWRFVPRWSLQATVGDRGSSILDLLWHHRY